MLQIRGGDKFLSVVKPLEANLHVGIPVGGAKSRVSSSEPIPLLLGVPQPQSGSSVDATYANLSRNALGTLPDQQRDPGSGKEQNGARFRNHASRHGRSDVDS